MNRRSALMLGLLAIFTLTLILLRLLVGHTLGWPADGIILKLRLTSMAAALIVGASLAQSGAFLQTLLRNPLASPYILGLATGAGVGVACVQLLELKSRTLGPSLESAAALIGAGIVVALVYRLGRRRGQVEPTTLLLVGVMISVIAGALLMAMQFALGKDADQLMRWMMGRIAPDTSLTAIVIAAVILILGFAFGWHRAPALDVALLEEDDARAIGLNVPALRWQLFVLASALAAVAVVLAGPIGFVGLVAPHLARLIVGSAHRTWLPASAMIGAALLLVADATVQLIPHIDFLPQQRGLWPVGILTSLIGGPVFIYLLRSSSSHAQGAQSW